MGLTILIFRSREAALLGGGQLAGHARRHEGVALGAQAERLAAFGEG